MREWDAIVEDTYRDKVWWGFSHRHWQNSLIGAFLSQIAYGWILGVCDCVFCVNVWHSIYRYTQTHIAQSSNFPSYNARLIFYLWKCNVSISILVAGALEQLFTIYRIFAFRMDDTPHAHIVLLFRSLSESCGIFA